MRSIPNGTPTPAPIATAWESPVGHAGDVAAMDTEPKSVGCDFAMAPCVFNGIVEPSDQFQITLDAGNPNG